MSTEFPLGQVIVIGLLVVAGYVLTHPQVRRDCKLALIFDRLTIPKKIERLFPILLALLVGGAYFLLCKEHRSPFDYTFRIASALLEGDMGLPVHPGSWLNEFVPWDNRYYSVFPLGAVVSMVPYALLVKLGVIPAYYSVVIVMLLGFSGCLCSYLLARHFFPESRSRAVFFALFMSFGTWHLANLLYGGAWQLAVGVAVVGQLATFYFLMVRRMPLLAGCCFALAFGNRTEILLSAPAMFWLLMRQPKQSKPIDAKQPWHDIALFCVAPVILGSATLYYNWARFGVITDFGYAHIPGVLEEPWYREGIFSFSAIWGNFTAMLIETWRLRPTYPYLVPSGFGGSILLNCPLLLILVHWNDQRDCAVRLVAWSVIVLLVAVLWLHGNPGGWQFSYRYGAVLLPWLLLIMFETVGDRVSRQEALLLVFSMGINLYGNYLFNWTSYV